MPDAINQKVVQQLQSKVRLWMFISWFCRNMHWIVGILGVTFSTLAASNYKPTWKYFPDYAVCSAICFAIMGFVNPQKWANLYIRAYRLLEPAIREYENSIITLKDLLDTHKHAEALLSVGEEGFASQNVYPEHTVSSSNQTPNPPFHQNSVVPQPAITVSQPTFTVKKRPIHDHTNNEISLFE